VSSTGAIDATARRDRSLRNRVLSAVVLGAVTLVLLWLGGRYWQFFVAVAAAIMAWEWGVLCGAGDGPARRGRLQAPGLIVILAALAGVLITSIVGPLQGVYALAAGAAIAAGLALLGSPDRAHWYALGVFYVGLPCIAIIWLRDQPSGGWTLLWLLVLVWAVDTGAYFAGRRIGGPRLAPRISPNKTWSGFLGGVVAAVAVGGIAAMLGNREALGLMLVLSAALAVLEQIGDLAESAAKRRAGVKDVSGLIPGHGGLLDRVDGLIFVTLAFALVQLSTDQRAVTWS
jgi:phosphatidate cytidylyltransferase